MKPGVKQALRRLRAARSNRRDVDEKAGQSRAGALSAAGGRCWIAPLEFLRANVAQAHAELAHLVHRRDEVADGIVTCVIGDEKSRCRKNESIWPF
jgi:hypothetical protein